MSEEKTKFTDRHGGLLIAILMFGGLVLLIAFNTKC